MGIKRENPLRRSATMVSQSGPEEGDSSDIQKKNLGLLKEI